jgi:hypothetical protein
MGPMAWIPFSAASVMEVIFYITGYTVLGKKKTHWREEGEENPLNF